MTTNDAWNIGEITWADAQDLIPLFAKRGMVVTWTQPWREPRRTGLLAMTVPEGVSYEAHRQRMREVAAEVMAEAESLRLVNERYMAL